MDPATLIGFVVSLVALLVFMIMEGSDPTALLFLPAIVLVVVATTSRRCPPGSRWR